MADADQLAADVAALRDELGRVGVLPEAVAQGAAADLIRQHLEEHKQHAATLAEAANAVAKAVNERKALVAERDAAMPTPEQITEAETAVAKAAAALGDGTGTDTEFRNATDRLADLLAQKKAAEEKFQRGEQDAAQTLDGSTADLPDPNSTSGSPLGALAPLAQMLGQMHPQPSPQAPGAGDPSQMQPQIDPNAALLDSLLPGGDDSSSTYGDKPIDAGLFPPGAGTTHTSSDEIPQPSTITGAYTPADVSGRAANSFTATGTPTLAGAPGTAPMGGMPMVPPMGGMGQGAANGAASKKTGNQTPILEDDPDFTGADIARNIATSGVIGRDYQSHTGGR